MNTGLGVIVIRDSLERRHIITDAEHSKYMQYSRAIDEHESIIVYSTQSHLTLNYRHVVSIEWTSN